MINSIKGFLFGPINRNSAEKSISSSSSEEVLSKALSLCRKNKAVPVALLAGCDCLVTKRAMLSSAGFDLNNGSNVINASVFSLVDSNGDDARWIANGYGSSSFNELSTLINRGVVIDVGSMSIVK